MFFVYLICFLHERVITRAQIVGHKCKPFTSTMVPGQLKITPSFSKFARNKCLYTRENEVKVDTNSYSIVERIMQ